MNAGLFPYQPKIGQWFSSAAQHTIAIGKFDAWLKGAAPQVHAAIRAKAPILLDGAAVAGSGALTPRNAKLAGMRLSGRGGLAGLGDDYTVDPVTGDVTSVPATTSAATVPSPVTAWGSQILDIAKSVVGIKQANDIVKLNISRAEAGLPPIDQSGIAPQVNVGLSAQTQKLLIGGGLLALAVFAFKGIAKR